jgi:tetratricopeptide (TPR) repeat protein
MKIIKKPMLFVVLLFLLSCNHKDLKSPQKEETKNPEDSILILVNKYPDSLLLKENLIQMYRENEDYKNAINSINNFLKNDSLNGRLWNIKAVLHFENGDTLKSIESFEKELIYLSSPTDSISLATLYAETKNAKAIKITEQLKKTYLSKYEKETEFINGLYKYYNSDFISAIAHYDKCINMDYTFMEAYREKAICLISQMKYKEAITTLNKAVILKNNFDEGYYYLGICYEKINKNEMAKQSYGKALLYSPDYIEAKQALEKLNNIKTEN